LGVGSWKLGVGSWKLGVLKSGFWFLKLLLIITLGYLMFLMDKKPLGYQPIVLMELGCGGGLWKYENS
jgi:hypothetical protein